MNEFISAITTADLMRNICEWPIIRKLADKNNIKILED